MFGIFLIISHYYPIIIHMENFRFQSGRMPQFITFQMEADRGFDKRLALFVVCSLLYTIAVVTEFVCFKLVDRNDAFSFSWYFRGLLEICFTFWVFFFLPAGFLHLLLWCKVMFKTAAVNLFIENRSWSACESRMQGTHWTCSLPAPVDPPCL